MSEQVQESKETMLHAILAVEPGIDNKYKEVAAETLGVFTKKPELFRGATRTYIPYTDPENPANQLPPESVTLTTTVYDKLAYTMKAFADYVNVNGRKEATNQTAKADVVVGDQVICKDVPATMLLGLESKLKSVRELCSHIPTLAPGIKWEKDPTMGEHVYRTVDNEITQRTAKTFRFQVLYPATDKHPAQIEKWEENVPIGQYSKLSWSGMMSPKEKSDLLERIDTLINAVKTARQRANQATVVPVNYGSEIVKYILG